MALQYPDPIVGNRKPPSRFSRLIGNDKQASGPLADKGMLERVNHKLCDNEADAYRPADEAVPPSAWTFNEIGRLSSVIEVARVSHKNARAATVP
jgi:hypothetical protein